MERVNVVSSFSIRNLMPGNELTKTMKSGVMEINGSEFPFVLRRRVRGKIEIAAESIRLSIINFTRGRKTTFLKAGYVSFLLTSDINQLWIYLKKEHAERLLSAIAIFNI